MKYIIRNNLITFMAILIAYSLFFYFITIPVDYEEIKIGEISVQVPVGWAMKTGSAVDYKYITFKRANKTLDIYFKELAEAPRDLSVYVRKSNYQKKILIFGDGIYAITRTHIFGRKYTALFTVNNKIYRLELKSPRTNDRETKKIFDTALLHIKISNKSTSPSLAEQLEVINAETQYLCYSISTILFLFLLGIVFIFALITFIQIFIAQKQGKLLTHKELSFHPAQSRKNVPWCHKGAKTVKLSSIYLTRDRFSIFKGKKELLRITPDKLSVFGLNNDMLDTQPNMGKNIRIISKQTIFFRDNYLEIQLGEKSEFTLRLYLQDSKKWAHKIKDILTCL